MGDEKKPDFSSLEKAVKSMVLALETYEKLNNTVSTAEIELLRDGVICRFEYTFELSWKTMKRFLEMYGMEQVDRLKNRDFFRVCFEAGLIRNPNAWFDFMLDRNQTSHVYDTKIAGDVYSSANSFIGEARYLLEQLRDRTK